jgi:FkbM family methyltransferase
MYRAAVSSPVGIAQFNERANDAVSSLVGVKGSLLHGEPEPTSTHAVETTTPDTIAYQSHTPADVVKIDVEGAEALVLAGAERLLAEHRTTFVIEAARPCR